MRFCFRFSRPLLTLAATATITIMILGIFGNLLTIVALIRCPKVRNVAADFIISLCAADCLFCILVLPFMALRYIRGAWTHGDGLLCTFVPFVQYGNVGVSLLCIAMITINRWNQWTNIYTNEIEKHFEFADTLWSHITACTLEYTNEGGLSLWSPSVGCFLTAFNCRHSSKFGVR